LIRMLRPQEPNVMCNKAWGKTGFLKCADLHVPACSRLWSSNNPRFSERPLYGENNCNRNRENERRNHNRRP